MHLLGLTGSIGTGKTTLATMMRRLGIPVHSADEVVHHLLRTHQGVRRTIAQVCPQAILSGRLDRTILGRFAFRDPPLLKRLEELLHPLVRQEHKRFVARHRRSPWVVLDVPLLFETHQEKLFDGVILVTVAPFIQAQRVCARPLMTHEKLEAIRHRQMKEAEKMKKADIIIRTGLGKRSTLGQLTDALKRYREGHTSLPAHRRLTVRQHRL